MRIYIYNMIIYVCNNIYIVGSIFSGPTNGTAAHGSRQMEDLLAKMLICTPSTWFTIITGQPCGSASWFFVVGEASQG